MVRRKHYGGRSDYPKVRHFDGEAYRLGSVGNYGSVEIARNHLDQWGRKDRKYRIVKAHGHVCVYSRSKRRHR